MKTSLYKIYCLIGAIGLFMASSCSDVLKEQPRSGLTPAFFETEQGIVGGLTAVYSHMRYLYGPIGAMYLGTNGTDECTWAVSQDGSGKELDTYGSSITPNVSVGSIWNNTFTYINTCNGIISIGSKNGMSPALIAEAKFFRAFDYFLLVTTYGGVPLDLGSGELEFNTTPSRTSIRNSVQDVYEKAILKDLREAVNELSDAPRLTGGVTKTAARFFLAKACLTYGWALEKSGTSGSKYFQEAYDVAVAAISNPGGFGLMETFYDVNLAANDRNKEIILYADHSNNPTFSESGNTTYTDTGSTESGMKENRSNFAINCNFEQAIGVVEANIVRRIASQDLGRPWSRIAPTAGALLNTFADKTHDSRYDGTFVSTYYANFKLAEPAVETKKGANGMLIHDGEKAWVFLPDDSNINDLLFVKNASGANEGGSGAYLPDEAYAVWTPSTINRTRYPGLWKFGPDWPDKTRNGPFNAPSTRPFPVAKFSELYFIAAEAAVKGANVQSGKSARELINVIRARAGKWRWDNNNRVAKAEDHSAEMTAATPQNIDIDYILTERSRELFAEGGRWYDLTRTGNLEKYAGEYYICESAPAEVKASRHVRDIKPHHYLRPVPQSQIDRMIGSDADKKSFQNPGY